MLVPSVSGKLGPSDPVVLILGWYRSKMRHVRKYAEAVEAAARQSGRGAAVLCSVCCEHTVMAPTSAPRAQHAKRLLDALEACELLAPSATTPPVAATVRRPLFVMSFSNGGAFIWQEMTKALRPGDGRATLYPRVATALEGTTFDSAPCYLHPTTGLRAITEGQPLVARLIAGSIFCLVGIPVGVFRRGPFWRAMTDDSTRVRQLFLYSTADQLCDADKVAELVEARKARGVDARGINFEDSPHVQHMRTYPQRYVQALADFLYHHK